MTACGAPLSHPSSSITTMSSVATSVRDLFRWRQRQVIVDEQGFEHVTYVNPPKPANPFTLLRSISLLGWGAYAVGFFCWTVSRREGRVLKAAGS